MRHFQDRLAYCGSRWTSTVTMAVAAAAIIAAVSTGPASAQRYGGPPNVVVAESRYGNGSVSGAVRPGRNGWQVRLPRGTWMDCVFSCSETLRRATVDFWATQGRGVTDTGPNYFRWDFRY